MRVGWGWVQSQAKPIAETLQDLTLAWAPQVSQLVPDTLFTKQLMPLVTQLDSSVGEVHPNQTAHLSRLTLPASTDVIGRTLALDTRCADVRICCFIVLQECVPREYRLLRRAMSHNAI